MCQGWTSCYPNIFAVKGERLGSSEEGKSSELLPISPTALNQHGVAAVKVPDVDSIKHHREGTVVTKRSHRSSIQTKSKDERPFEHSPGCGYPDARAIKGQAMRIPVERSISAKNRPIRNFDFAD